MDITSAKFLKGITASDVALENTLSQVAFIGRSNVGKSSVINSLTKQKNLARSSTSPGRTREINLFLINDSFYLLDLPGYGYAKASKEVRAKLKEIVFGYLFESRYKQKKVVLIIDANVGMTELDLEMLNLLKENKKSIIILANKIDKVKSSEHKKKLASILELAGDVPVIEYSARKNIGRKQLLHEIL